MTNKERLACVESIYGRQDAGIISSKQASEDFDELLYRCSVDDGAPCLVYLSDSTGFTADSDSDLMLFPKAPGVASNTGIYARGPRRGEIVTMPEGAVPDCLPTMLAHFSAKGVS